MITLQEITAANIIIKIRTMAEGAHHHPLKGHVAFLDNSPYDPLPPAPPNPIFLLWLSTRAVNTRQRAQFGKTGQGYRPQISHCNAAFATLTET